MQCCGHAAKSSSDHGTDLRISFAGVKPLSLTAADAMLWRFEGSRAKRRHGPEYWRGLNVESLQVDWLVIPEGDDVVRSR